MEFDTKFWIQIMVYAVSFATAWGSMHTRIKFLEQKMDKHNNVIERTIIVEQSLKSAHHRIDEIREEINNEG